MGTAHPQQKRNLDSDWGVLRHFSSGESLQRKAGFTAAGEASNCTERTWVMAFALFIVKS